MVLVKKLIFAPLFLISFFILLLHLSIILKSYDFIFSLSVDNLIQLILIASLLNLSCFLFILFVTFSSSWKFTIPAGILASFLPMLFLEPTAGIILGVGVLVSLVLITVNLDNTLKTYLNFQPAIILGPSIRHLSTLLILVISLTYFLSINKIIAEKGFQIPDSVIEAALKFSSIEQPSELNISPNSSISTEQLQLLKQNPEALKQFGLDPKILDSLGENIVQTPKNLTENFIKQTLKDQLDKILKPYLTFIPIILAVLLFFMLQSFTSLINLLIYPLLWLLFTIFEKTGFIKFTQEMRPVKKMVI